MLTRDVLRVLVAPNAVSVRRRTLNTAWGTLPLWTATVWWPPRQEIHGCGDAEEVAYRELLRRVRSVLAAEMS